MNSHNKWQSGLVSLEKSLSLSQQLVGQLMDGQTVEIYDFINSKTTKFEGVYDCVVYAASKFYLACLNMFPEEVAETIELVKDCSSYCNIKRKKWTITSAVAEVLKIKPSYSDYTEEEVHAEICYALLLTMRGILNFINDNNILSLVSGSYRLKLAHESYTTCNKLLKHHKFASKELQEVFTQGTKFGIGISNLCLSSMPKRLLSVLQFIGYRGDEKIGYEILLDGFLLSTSINVGGMLCFATITFCHLLARHMLGSGCSTADVMTVEMIFEKIKKKFPNSAITHYVEGRIANLNGQCDEAIDYLHKSIKRNASRITIQLLSFWEMATCHIIKGDCRAAAKQIRRMREETNLSKCCFAYFEASLLLSLEDITEAELRHATQLLEETPELMAEYCGKHVPFEKFTTRKARQFFAQDKYLLLPHYEFLYLVNFFALLTWQPDKLNKIMAEIDHQIKILNTRKEWQFYPDNYCLAMFLKGMCLKHLGNDSEASQCFQEVLDKESDIYSDVYLILFAHLEKGILDTEAGRLEEALAHFKSAKKRRMFWIEFRIHSAREKALQLLKSQKK
ncbi:hypothetical protein CHUAL_001875 [Chamberlinius hualienensis]